MDEAHGYAARWVDPQLLQFASLSPPPAYRVTDHQAVFGARKTADGLNFVQWRGRGVELAQAVVYQRRCVRGQLSKTVKSGSVKVNSAIRHAATRLKAIAYSAWRKFGASFNDLYRREHEHGV